MKNKFAIALLCVLILCGCSNEKYDEPYAYETRIKDESVNYDSSLDIAAKNLYNLIIDDKLAYEIAKPVLKRVYPEVDPSYCEVVVSSLKHKNLFIVSWLPQSSGLGGGYNIVISSINGEILGFWIG